MKQRTFVIADDLSGALDASACFARYHHKVCVALSPDSVLDAMDSGADVIAVNTGSREGNETTARAQVRAVLAHIPQGSQIFKKIDSRLKGHVAAETKELLSLGFTRILVAPAIPKLGRIVEAGQLSGVGVENPLPIRDIFAGLNIETFIPDTTSDADLDASIATLDTNTLIVGASGLSEAIARAGGRPIGPLGVPKGKKILLAIGSRDPITLTQIDTLSRSRTDIEIVVCPNGHLPTNLPNAPIVLVQLTPGSTRELSTVVTDRFSKTLAIIVDQMEPDTLVASGGETAQGVLTILGANSLELVGEARSGVPVSHCDVSGQRLTVLTKSGGFGGRTLLTELLSDLQE